MALIPGQPTTSPTLSPIGGVVSMVWELSDYSLPQPLSRFALTQTTNKDIYLFGDWNTRNYHWNVDTPYWWDYITNTIQISCYAQCAAVSRDGKIIYIANHGGDTILTFDVTSKSVVGGYISHPNSIRYSCLESDANDGGDSLYFVGGYDHTFVQIYNTTDKSWSIIIDMPLQTNPSNFMESQCKYVDGNLWIFGGRSASSPDQFYNGIYRYNIKHKHWVSMGFTLPTPLIRASTVLGDNGYIYLIGGYSPSPGRLQSVFKFNSNSLALGIETINSLTAPRSLFGAALLNSNLYLFGGIDAGANGVASIEIGNLSHEPISGPYFDGISTEWEYYLNVPWNFGSGA
eukprot:202616_1